jgi:leader peptidase (prepilin peptidase)/N-methyltransferase
MTMALTLILGAFGSLIGSFLNVVVYRVPRGASVVTPGSACGSCGHAIRWYDNMPVISWLLLRGRCRDCSARISVRYPLVELAGATVFVSVALLFVPAAFEAPTALLTASALLVLLAFLYLGAISIALVLIDLDVQRLPNQIVLPAYGVGAVLFALAAALSGDWGSLLRAAIGAVALGGAYLVIALVRPGGMGMGDVKLAGVLGLFLAWLGWNVFAVGAFAAFLLGGVFGLVILARGAGRRAAVPFGPWMIGGAWIAIFAGDAVAHWYLSLFGLGGS